MPSDRSTAREVVRRENDPQLLVLTSLASGPKHGHALLLDIDDFAGVRLGPGSLYGAISRLERRGLIEALGAEGRTRPYRLTTEGTVALEAAVAGLTSIVDEATRRLRSRRASASGRSASKEALV